MSIRVFAKKLDTAAMEKLQEFQYSEKLLLADTVPAGSGRLGRTAVSNLGDFLCLFVTGHFETLRGDGAGPPANTIDDAVNHLRGQLIDGAGQKKLFNDFIPFDLWLSPGRERSNDATNVVTPQIAPAPLADTAPAPFPLFYPLEFEYLFTANSDILLDVRNDSDVEIDYEICFHGIRRLASAAVRGVK